MRQVRARNGRNGVTNNKHVASLSKKSSRYVEMLDGQVNDIQTDSDDEIDEIDNSFTPNKSNTKHMKSATSHFHPLNSNEQLPRSSEWDRAATVSPHSPASFVDDQVTMVVQLSASRPPSIRTKSALSRLPRWKRGRLKSSPTASLSRTATSRGREREDSGGIDGQGQACEVWKLVLEVSPALVIATGGLVGSGLVLDRVQFWPVFQEIPGLFILLPVLLGL